MWTLLRPCVSVKLKLDHRSYTEDVSERQGVDKFPWQRSSIGTFSEVEIGFLNKILSTNSSDLFISW